MTERSDRFLDAFSDVEHHLRSLVSADGYQSFYDRVRTASETDAAVRRFATDLKEYADLRNAIVHERSDGHAIADPYEETVQKLERIASLLTSPPSLLSVAHRPVTSLSSTEPVGRAASLMKENEFSQLPIYDDRIFVGLLTASTVVWWLSDALASGVGLIEELPIGDVLRYTEDPEHHVMFCGSESTVYEALELFDRGLKSGRPVDALLVTDSGRRDQQPLGIVTVFDLPSLYEAAGL